MSNEEINCLKKDIEDKLSHLVNYVNIDYAHPIKIELLKEIDKRLKFYLESVEDKDLQIFLLLNEFIDGLQIGFGSRT